MKRLRLCQTSRWVRLITSDGVHTLRLHFQETQQQITKRNANADVTCEWTLTTIEALLYSHSFGRPYRGSHFSGLTEF